MVGRDSRDISALALVPSTVRHLHPEESMWEAMLAGWTMQMRARALTVSTVEPRLSTVRRFMAFTGEYPWRWSAEDVDAWSTELLSGRIARSTLRGYQGCVQLFCD